MPQGLGALGVAPQQHINDVAGAEALPGAIYRGQGFLRQFCAVEGDRRVKAIVAVAAWHGGFAKIRQQAYAAATSALGQTHQGIEFLLRDTLERIGPLGLFNHAALRHDVAHAVGHPGICRCSITSGTPGFLVIRFDVARQIEMCDEAHVRFVNAHAKRNRGGDDQIGLV